MAGAAAPYSHQCYPARLSPAPPNALAGFHNPDPPIYKRIRAAAAYSLVHVAAK